MKILAFGRSGQLGQALARRPRPAGAELIQLGRAEADLQQPAALSAAVAAHAPDLVVIAAAYTAVDGAESDAERAHAVNADAPGAIGAAAAAAGAPVIHVSTDYVFDGAKSGPWLEDDPTGPLGVYGASKLAGERALLAAQPRSAILRTSWVVSATGKNFVKTMLRLGAERDRLTIVDDQWGRPTGADDLADAIYAIAPQLARDAAPAGVFHFSNGGDPVTWAGVAREVFRLWGAAPISSTEVAPIPTEDYPTPAARPKNSVMDLARIGAAYGVTPRRWEAMLADIVAELRAESAREQGAEA